MLQMILRTKDDVAMTILRLGLGIMILPHGWAKVTSFDGTMQFFTGMGIPYAAGVLAIASEFLGGLGLLVGLLGRVAAFGVGSTMVVAALTVHLPNGFFMNWSGSQAGEGYEFQILAVAIALALVLRGSGAWSLDRVLSAKKGD